MNPNFILYCFGFFIGASIGSFYYTLSLRILEYFYGRERKNRSFFRKLSIILTKPSSCPACQKTISAGTLIPVIGYFISKNKCAECNEIISHRYPLTEFWFGALFTFLFFLSSNFLYSVLMLCLFGHLLISIHTDFYYFSLDYENLPFILFFGVLVNFSLDGTFFLIEDFYVFFGFAAFYFTIWFFYKKGIGLGDVFYGPIFAFVAGHPWWMLFLNSSYLIALLVAFLTKRKGESFRNKPLPMGVYFSIGLMMVLVCKLIYYSGVMNQFI